MNGDDHGDDEPRLERVIQVSKTSTVDALVTSAEVVLLACVSGLVTFRVTAAYDTRRCQASTMCPSRLVALLILATDINITCGGCGQCISYTLHS